MRPNGFSAETNQQTTSEFTVAFKMAREDEERRGDERRGDERREDEREEDERGEDER